MLFAGLIGKGSTTAGAAGLLSLLRSHPVDVDRLTSAGPTAMTEPHLLREGGEIAHNVLGDSFTNAASAISRHSGVGINAAQSLLGLAAPPTAGSN